jgi:hypothetical protein
MKIATILPFAHLDLEASNDYHMFLAHLMDNPEYRAFVKWQGARCAHTILDNGVVETGIPLSAYKLMRIAKESGITEMTLPDEINDRMVTKHLHYSAMEMLEGFNPNQKVIVIPQGCTREDWIDSVNDMLTLASKYPKQITTIGISKFCVNRTKRDGGTKMFDTRLEALKAVPELPAQGLAIHLLGCPDHPDEIREIRKEFPIAVRGVDSGLPVFYTMHGRELNENTIRPVGLELDFNIKFVTEGRLALLKRNIAVWKTMING